MYFGFILGLTASFLMGEPQNPDVHNIYFLEFCIPIHCPESVPADDLGPFLRFLCSYGCVLLIISKCQLSPSSSSANAILYPFLPSPTSNAQRTFSL